MNVNGFNKGFALVAAGLLVAGHTPVLAQTSSPTPSSSVSGSQTIADGCVTDYDAAAGVDYFPDKAEIAYAQTFSVEYFPAYKVLEISGVTYVLYQCGTPQPELAADVAVQQYISVPVTTVATGTPDHIPRIELLGHRDSIVAYTGDASRIGSPCVDALVADGSVLDAITFDTECQSDVVDNAALVNASVEVTFGDSLTTSYCPDAPETYNGVAIMLYLETGPTSGLAQGEAIKLFSLFYNEEAKANTLFDEIEFLWFCTKNNAQGCSIRLDDSPEVAWFSYVPTDPSSSAYDAAGSGWGAPSENTYYAHAVNNTGGTMLTCGDVDGLMTDEQMVACFGSATVCVFAADYEEVVLAFGTDALDQLACVQNERVYDVTLSGINAWFEANSVEPHVLMEDMVVVLHGEDFDYGIGSYERLLLRDVFTEESGTGTYFPDVGTCDDPDAPLEIQGMCDIIVDFGTCDGSLTADEQESSPAASVLPGAFGGGGGSGAVVWAGAAAALVASAASLY